MSGDLMGMLIERIEGTRRKDDDKPSFPMLEAQAMELVSRWEASREPSDLKPGDLCREKPGLGSMRRPYRTSQLMIVWRMLDQSNWIDQQHLKFFLKNSSAGTDRPDCMVGLLTDDGSAVAIRPHELAQLQRWQHGDDDETA